jgi:hypothetical protein
MDAATTTDTPPAPRRNWIELVATLLLALAAVATAWSSYQAARWNGEQARAGSRVNALRIDAAREQGLAEGQTQIDVATYVEWVNATRSGDDELAAFYEERFRPEFEIAFEAWQATDPLTDADAPESPFAMDAYDLEANREAARYDREAAAESATVQRNIQRSTNYVLGVVLFAVALFFAGMSTKIDGRGARLALVTMGCVVFLCAAAWVATFPISISV